VVIWYIFPFWYVLTKKNLASLVPSSVAGNSISSFVCTNAATYVDISLLRTVFNNTSWPLGVKFAPRGELRPLGVLYTPSFFPRGEHYLMFKRTKGQTEGLHP
jgi:hypothetical protein